MTTRPVSSAGSHDSDAVRSPNVGVYREVGLGVPTRPIQGGEYAPDHCPTNRKDGQPCQGGRNCVAHRKR